ncbi:Sm domain-containing protein [Caenorhabditis elegans]|uniref:Sm domain-containing protein n=1 Tax=Caenorhabditis elegans TaxID=6239 RepID=Q9GYQ8_CAEEL|nr:Sm domain-containing protein [Caenorhabditis elegans]CCD67704.1 Sm domain-containing protein [Caenorhabditis elegans]|eukprot:NP_501319.2 Uncharacterized protein CELE_C49H3.4 [Caenorhabditis elegans]
MAEDFDIEKFLKTVAEKNPELIEGVEGNSEDFKTDEFEKNLVDLHPELAEEICDFDERTVREEKEKTISKKQQARDRQIRLEAMMTDGRSVIEKKGITFHDKMITIEGPMSMIANAVINQKRIEVRVRSAIRIDRIFEGIPTTFDEHFNLMMKDVTETVLHGRKAQKEFTNRKEMQLLLPEFLRWKEGGNWPMKVGTNRLIEHRFQRACFIKGDSVVLVRMLP